MQKMEKIGIAIVVILIIISAIILWPKQRAANPKIKINCEMACHQVGNDNWTFPGAGPINENTFSTEEDCVSACQNKN